MTIEYTLTLARIKDSITKVPDRLSNSQGELLRSEFAKIFGQIIIGHEDKDGGLYLTLPFQTSLLTDPVLYIVAGGLLVLDHPTLSGQSEFASGERAHIIDLNPKYSLYASRYPRMIACARKGEEIQASWMANELNYIGFFGPFGKAAA